MCRSHSLSSSTEQSVAFRSSIWISGIEESCWYLSINSRATNLLSGTSSSTDVSDSSAQLSATRYQFIDDTSIWFKMMPCVGDISADLI